MPPPGFYSLSGSAMFKAISPSLRPRSALLWSLVCQSPPSDNKRSGDGDRGFTMFEVLIALMISFLFLTGTLNAMVMATVMRVKAERQAQAGYWIKEDLERVRALADSYKDQSGCPTGVGTAFRDANNSGDANLDNNGLASLPAPANRTILGRTASLTRTPTVSGNVLQLNYIVRNIEITDTNKSILASLYTEVLPAAALTCP
ncbi:prepilin-type N-terminal cleavage/methylation domain-containing protein [Synechocystis sp. PCC 7339]|nr:prepilin-type N-terminal cleavage/methylation domain-containing protein [Synechocystis sp. PCC 7339]